MDAQVKWTLEARPRQIERRTRTYRAAQAGWIFSIVWTRHVSAGSRTYWFKDEDQRQTARYVIRWESQPWIRLAWDSVRALSFGERGEWPDIDLDLPSGDQRERVIQYVYKRYGKWARQ